MQYEVEGEETMEEIAEHYLCELLNRFTVQVGVKGSTGRGKSCRLHDLMRDLCLLKANQENFLWIVQLQDRKKQVHFSSNRRVHGLAIYLGEECLKIFPQQEWCVTEEAMPGLCQLVIDYCQKLKMVPDGLRFITSNTFLPSYLKIRLLIEGNLMITWWQNPMAAMDPME